MASLCSNLLHNGHSQRPARWSLRVRENWSACSGQSYLMTASFPSSLYQTPGHQTSNASWSSGVEPTNPEPCLVVDVNVLWKFPSAGLKNSHLQKVHNWLIGCYERRKKNSHFLNWRGLKWWARDNAVKENGSERECDRGVLFRLCFMCQK